MILSVREKSKEKRRDARGKGVEEHYLGLGFHKEGAIYNMTESLVPVIFPRQAQERKTKPLKYNCPLPPKHHSGKWDRFTGRNGNKSPAKLVRYVR